MHENGSRFIDKLIAASPTARRKFTVLGQDIYVSPLTRAAMTEAMPKDGISRPPDYEGLFMIVHCAEKEDGSKLFEVKDIDALRERVSLELLQQIESGMLGALAPDEKEMEAVVQADPPSASA
jgi:hypothetical protein